MTMVGAKCVMSPSSLALLFSCLAVLFQTFHVSGNRWMPQRTTNHVMTPSFAPTTTTDLTSSPLFSPSSRKNGRPSSKSIPKRKKHKKIRKHSDTIDTSRKIPKRKKVVRKKRSKSTIYNPIESTDPDYRSHVLKEKRSKKVRPSTNTQGVVQTRTKQRVKGRRRRVQSGQPTSTYQMEENQVTKRRKKKRKTSAVRGETEQMNKQKTAHTGNRKKRKRKKTKLRVKKSPNSGIVSDSIPSQEVQPKSALIESTIQDFNLAVSDPGSNDKISVSTDTDDSNTQSRNEFDEVATFELETNTTLSPNHLPQDNDDNVLQLSINTFVSDESTTIGDGINTNLFCVTNQTEATSIDTSEEDMPQVIEAESSNNSTTLSVGEDIVGVRAPIVSTDDDDIADGSDASNVDDLQVDTNNTTTYGVFNQTVDDDAHSNKSLNATEMSSLSIPPNIEDIVFVDATDVARNTSEEIVDPSPHSTAVEETSEMRAKIDHYPESVDVTNGRVVSVAILDDVAEGDDPKVTSESGMEDTGLLEATSNTTGSNKIAELNDEDLTRSEANRDSWSNVDTMYETDDNSENATTVNEPQTSNAEFNDQTEETVSDETHTLTDTAVCSEDVPTFNDPKDDDDNDNDGGDESNISDSAAGSIQDSLLDSSDSQTSNAEFNGHAEKTGGDETHTHTLEGSDVPDEKLPLDNDENDDYGDSDVDGDANMNSGAANADGSLQDNLTDSGENGDVQENASIQPTLSHVVHSYDAPLDSAASLGNIERAHPSLAPSFVKSSESVTLSDELIRAGLPSHDESSDIMSVLEDVLSNPIKDENHLTISIVTWNLAEESPSEEDASFIKRFRKNGKDKRYGSDLVLISGQECENIKPRRSEGSRSREFRRLMITMLGKDYVPLALHLLGGIQFGLFCKRSVLGDIEQASVADVTCGIGNVFHNKGAIGCFLKIKAKESATTDPRKQTDKSVRMLFVTAHMAAHVKNTEARDMDFWRIVRELELQAPARFLSTKNPSAETSGKFLLDSTDRIFFCGDLNYRIDLPREEVEYTISRIHSMLESNTLEKIFEAKQLREHLFKYDQLRATIALERAFPGFAEGRITFAPTFKFDKGSDEYDTSHKQRIPAWTDRVLYKPIGTHVLEYDSIATAQHSDHRPVFATFLTDRTGRVLSRNTGKRRKRAATNKSKRIK